LRDLLELDEEQNESLLGELLEVASNVTRGHELFVYQKLTIWGDQVATYTVRENVRKRANKLLHQLNEFPLNASPRRIVETYWWAHHELRDLRVPPGDAPEDRALFRASKSAGLKSRPSRFIEAPVHTRGVGLVPTFAHVGTNHDSGAGSSSRIRDLDCASACARAAERWHDQC
jgi:hypothetical protein